MQPGPLPEDAVRRQLDRVLSSGGFARNERLSHFLRFVVQRHLEGRDGELKESVLGVEVFGRQPGFDPRVDGIVRTEAIRLRARLDKYYASEGHADPLIIALPKGGYRPVILERAVPGRTAIGRTRPTWKMGLVVTAALLVIAVAGATWWSRRSAVPVAVAVLPFENLSHDPTRDYVADGVTDQLISSLAVIEGLTVPSRTSSFALRGRTVNVVQAGSELQADYLVEGSVLHSDGRLRVNAALVRVHDDQRIWSQQFDRQLTDVFTVHDDISRGIVDTLRLKVSPGRHKYRSNVEAYDLYLRGREQMAAFPSHNRPIAPTAIGYYEQAIARDPSYALAYAGLADTYLAVEKNIGTAPKLGPDLLAQAKTAAAKALELDPMLSEAHGSMASILAREYAWQDAERHFRRAIDLDQNNALAHLGLGGDVLLMQGRVDAALDEVRWAVRLDQLSAYTNTEYGRALFWARQYDAAVGQLRIAIAIDPGRAKPYGFLARALYAQGRTADAMTVFDEAVKRGALLPGLSNSDLACVAARAGRRGEQVDAMLQRAFSSRMANIAARVYACVGDAPQALHHLEKALAAHEPNLAQILQDPFVDWMHANDRFAPLRRQLTLPDRSLPSPAH